MPLRSWICSRSGSTSSFLAWPNFLIRSFLRFSSSSLSSSFVLAEGAVATGVWDEEGEEVEEEDGQKVDIEEDILDEGEDDLEVDDSGKEDMDN